LTTSPSFQQADADSLRDGLRSVLRSWWIILICGVVAAGGALAYGDHDQEKSYSASATLSFTSGQYSNAIGVGSGVVDAPRILQNAAQTISLPVIGERVVEALGPRVTAGASIKPVFTTKTDFLSVTATTPVRANAAPVANAAAHAYLDYRDEVTARQVAPVRELLTKQARKARTAEARQAILVRRDTLDAYASVQNQQVVLAQEAVGPGASSTSNTKRNALIALVLGLVVGVAVSLLRGPPPKRDEAAS
jgi:uncharacterized protein involved in exopolysaccharide biosynthesis